MLLTGKGKPQHAIHGGLFAKFGTANAPLKPGLQAVAARRSILDRCLSAGLRRGK